MMTSYTVVFLMAVAVLGPQTVESSVADMVSNLFRHLLDKVKDYSGKNETVEQMESLLTQEVDSVFNKTAESDLLTEPPLLTTEPSAEQNQSTAQKSTVFGAASFNTTTPAEVTEVTTGVTIPTATTTTPPPPPPSTPMMSYGGKTVGNGKNWPASILYIDYMNKTATFPCTLPLLAEKVLDTFNGDGMTGIVDVYHEVFSSKVLARLQLCRQTEDVDLHACMGNEFNNLSKIVDKWFARDTQEFCYAVPCFKHAVNGADDDSSTWRMFYIYDMVLSSFCALLPKNPATDSLRKCAHDILVVGHVMFADVMNREVKGREYPQSDLCFNNEVCRDDPSNPAIKQYKCGESDDVLTTPSGNDTSYGNNHTSESSETATTSHVQRLDTTQSVFEINAGHLVHGEIDHFDDNTGSTQEDDTEKSIFSTENTKKILGEHTRRTDVIVGAIVPTCTLTVVGVVIVISVMCARIRRRRYRRDAVGYQEVKEEFDDLP